MFIQDVVKNFTIEDLSKFVNTAFNVTKQGLPGYAVKDFMSVVEKNAEDTQSTNDNQVNVPCSPDNGVLIVIGLFNHIHQIWIGCYSGTIKTRYYNSNSWTQWRDI